MDEFTTLRQVRQVAQFPLLTSLDGGELALLQRGGLGGPYGSISAADLVGWGLASGGTLRLSAGEAISWNGTLAAPVTLRAGPLGFSLSAPVSVSGNLDAVGLSVAGQPVATHNWVQDSFNYLLSHSVASWNGRTGAVELLVEDILRAGGAPADNPVFSGRVVGPTHWNPALCDDTLVTSAWVQQALCAGLWTFAASPYFYGSPTASTPPAGDYSLRIANTQWVTDEINTLLDSPQLVGIMTAGVTTFNGRSGSVTLTSSDITGAGGALLASPAFTGTPTAPTAAVGTSSTQLATTAFVAGARTAINVNSLTGGIPLVGDGVTANLAAWQNVVQNLYNLNNDPPVAVTLANGTPCVVTWNAHGLKPNQAFGFALAAGGALSSGISLGTTYFVTAANLTANTFTFSTFNNAIVAGGMAEGAPVGTTGTSTGVQVVLTSNQWISLYVPPGAYCTNPPFGSSSNRTNVDLFPMGISKVRVIAYGAMFDDLTCLRPTGSAGSYFALPGPGPGGCTLNWFDYVNTAGVPGSFAQNGSVTLKTISNASKYYVGMWVVVLGLDLMDFLGSVTGGPPNNHFWEYNQITAINAGTGVITFRNPLRFAYADTFPVMSNPAPGTSLIGGGQAMIVPMSPAWDMEFEIQGARFPINEPGAVCRRQVYVDCMWDKGFNPTAGREIVCRKCRLPGANQIDKMMEYLEFDECEGIFNFSSTSLHICQIKGCRGTINFTPRNLLVENSIVDLMKIGCSLFGGTDAVVIRNSRFSFFNYYGRNDGPGNGPATGGNAMLANWTFSNGTFSRDLSTVAQNVSYQPWAIPGAKCFFSDEAGVYNNMGAPFAILNVYMTGTVFKFDTTLKALPTLQTSAAVTVTIASPAVFTGPTLTNGTPVLLQTTGALPTGFTASTTLYYVVNASGATFQLAATSGGAAIASSGTQSGTHTVVANPLHINIHPCPRFTSIGNTGTQAIIDMNGAIDEPVFSRFKRSFGGKQVTNPIFQQNIGRIWGRLVSMTVNVVQAGTAGTVAITCPGFTQPNLATSNFSQTIDLTVAGTRTVTPAGVTGSLGADVLAAYGDWLSGGQSILLAFNAATCLQIIPSGTSGQLNNNAVFDVEILTDQGITRFNTMFGGDTQTNAAALSTRVDSSITQIWPLTP